MGLPQLKYNPGVHDDGELIASFVVRHQELDLILEVLRENTGSSNQHLLIVGPRGSGKTTLVRRVAAEVRSDPALDAVWYPLIFAEESYMVSSPGEFWLEALFHLGDQTQDSRWDRAYRDLQKEHDEPRLRQRALAQLMDFAAEAQKRVLLIVENLNMLLGEQINQSGGWDLRHTLLNEPQVMLLGTATSRFEEVKNIDKAWFETLAIHELEPLGEEGCRVFWEDVTNGKSQARSLRPIQILTGGNVRLLRILAEFAAGKSFRELMGQLVQLIDDHTEYFKGHLDNLAAKERKVFVTLLENWDPATARDVAEAARLSVSKTSALLNRLVGRGAVQVVEHKGRRKIYQAAERLFNIYYLMRRRGHPSNRVRAIVAFMVQFYEGDDLVSVVQRFADEACGLEQGERADFYSAYQHLVGQKLEQELVQKILESTPDNFFMGPDVPVAMRKMFVESKLPQLLRSLFDDRNFERFSNLLADGVWSVFIERWCFKVINDNVNLSNALIFSFLRGVHWAPRERCETSNLLYVESLPIPRENFATWALLAGLLVDQGNCREAFNCIKPVLVRAPKEESALQFMIFFSILAAASGFAKDILAKLGESSDHEELKALAVGVRLFLGEEPLKAQEIMRVGTDVAEMIRKMQTTFKVLVQKLEASGRTRSAMRRA